MNSRTLLVVVARPSSRSPGVALIDGGVEVRVAAPAREGLATDAVRGALAAALRRPRSSVTLVRGATSRRKTFEIMGLTFEQAIERIAQGMPLGRQQGSG
jgi:uncharacterized protein